MRERCGALFRLAKGKRARSLRICAGALRFLRISSLDSGDFFCYLNRTKIANTVITPEAAPSGVRKDGGRMININFRDARPIYEQVRDGFRQLILTGVLPADSRLPSVRELAAQLAINPNTIQRAYRELEGEGYICSVPGRGSFVRQGDAAALARRAELLERWDALSGELKQLGLTEEELCRRLKGEAYD